MRPDTILAMATKQVAKRSGRKAAKAAKNVKTTARPAHDSVAGRGAKRGGAGARAGTKRGKPGASATAKNSKKDAGLELQPARIEELLRRLAQAYPNAECALHHRNAWELLVATILSAQCTDARVNMVTPELFRRFPTPQAFAQASLPAIEEEIRSTGFYHNKAKSISGAAKKVVSEFGGRVPETMQELLTLPGVARKTANVVLGVAFEKAEGVVVDTHVLRLSHRLGLTRAEDPKRVEEDLMRVIPRERWIAFSHEMIHHGRQICVARKPKCIDCPLETLCNAADKTWSSH
jgi:endonuclease-3